MLLIVFEEMSACTGATNLRLEGVEVGQKGPVTMRGNRKCQVIEPRRRDNNRNGDGTIGAEGRHHEGRRNPSFNLTTSQTD